MSYPSDLTDDQWELPEPVLNASGKHGRKQAADLRTVVDAMPHIVQSGCRWRYLPQSFGPWTWVRASGTPGVSRSPPAASVVAAAQRHSQPDRPSSRCARNAA